MGLRQDEVTRIQHNNQWTATIMGIATSMPVMASVISFIVFAATGNALDSARIFPALGFFGLLRFVSSTFYVHFYSFILLRIDGFNF
jgi:hypothetical protein